MQARLILVCLTGWLVLNGSEPGRAFPAPDIVTCRVIYPYRASSGETQYNGGEVSVSVSDLPKLPTTSPVKTLAAGSFGLPDFKGTIQDETDKEIITYTGHFTAVVAKELFLPHGSPVVLRPQVWYPAQRNDGTPEIYTTTDQSGLQALWMRTPLWGDNIPPVEGRYFAVLVQLYDYVSKPVRCHFTGTRTIRAKSLWALLGGSTTENLTDAETKFVNAPERKLSIYPAVSAIHM